MPVRFIQAEPTPFMTGSHPGVASVGVDTDTGEFKYQVPGETSARIPPLDVPVTVELTSASVDANVFIAQHALQLVAVREVHSVAGAGSSTVQVRKCTGTTAPASGTAMLSAAIALDATANTVQSGSLTATTADLQLAAGDRVAIDLTGTISSLVGTLTLLFKRI